ncbi:DUF5947 family protein [Streptomyces sp. NPDC051322]|uniref:DUF5947 family protein n=1 Tax=Streptomyces sp. NPDC051322 TaxID=3154645 RepID=UPI00344E0137
MSAGALERVIRRAGARRAEAAEHCELCSEPVPADHRHMVDTDRGELLCACRPCSLLFVRDAASRGHYRLVPQRRIRLAPVSTEPLGVPVGLAFFVPRADGTVSAHYPSPAGATEWEVDAQAWCQVVDHCPQLADLAADVEALLVNTARDARHHWIVPVDDCFRMVAVVRREWKGLSGGGRVWPEIERFFAELTEHR